MPSFKISYFVLILYIISIARSVYLFTGELNKPDDTVTIVSGAPGASPKNRFVQEKGLALTVTLDLKLLADIGLVG